MSTKLNPGAYDCYAQALPDEPMFILLARDAYAPILLGDWATHRGRAIRAGMRPVEDWAKVAAARRCAGAMLLWRRENDGRWRKDVPVSQHAFEEQFTGNLQTMPGFAPAQTGRTSGGHTKAATPERIGAISATSGAPPRPNLAPGPWVHYKFNTVYELLNVALNEGTGEWMVVHLNRQTMNVFVRPVSEWTEIVGTLDGREVPRFRAPDPGPSKGRE